MKKRSNSESICTKTKVKIYSQMILGSLTTSIVDVFFSTLSSLDEETKLFFKRLKISKLYHVNCVPIQTPRCQICWIKKWDVDLHASNANLFWTMCLHTPATGLPTRALYFCTSTTMTIHHLLKRIYLNTPCDHGFWVWCQMSHVAVWDGGGGEMELQVFAMLSRVGHISQVVLLLSWVVLLGGRLLL